LFFLKGRSICIKANRACFFLSPPLQWFQNGSWRVEMKYIVDVLFLGFFAIFMVGAFYEKDYVLMSACFLAVLGSIFMMIEKKGKKE
jgi:hypothetical protein